MKAHKGLRNSRNFDFSKFSFDGAMVRTVDSGFIGQDISFFKRNTDLRKIKRQMQENGLGIVPITKMIHKPAHMVDREGLKELILYTCNRILERAGNDFDFCTPGLDLTLPPYFGMSMPVVRVIVNGFLRRSAPNGGGIAGSQYADIFYSDGGEARTIREFIRNISAEYREYMKKHIFAQTSRHRSAGISFPWSEKPELTLVPEDRGKSFVINWLNIFKRNYKKSEGSADQDSLVLEPVSPNLTRDLKIIHFASSSPLPSTYEESRGRSQDPDHKNCVFEFENHLNAELDKLHAEGWNILHYQLVQKYQTTLPIGNLEGQYDEMPLNHFFAILQCERMEYCEEDEDVILGKAQVGDRLSDTIYPRRQVRLVAGTMKYTETVPDFDTQQAVAEPLNKLARDIHEPLRDWNSTIITYGYMPGETQPEPMVRLVHSVMLKEPDPINDETDRASKIRNVRWRFRVFRGPHSKFDPSNEDPIKDPRMTEEKDPYTQFPVLSGLAMRGKRLSDKRKSGINKARERIKELQLGELTVEKANEIKELRARMERIKKNYTKGQKVFSEMLYDSASKNEKHNEELIRYKIEADRVHEWDWMMEGAIADAIRDCPGEIKAIVTGRQYWFHNFAGSVQGFHGTIFSWWDISRPNTYLFDL